MALKVKDYFIIVVETNLSPDELNQARGSLEDFVERGTRVLGILRDLATALASSGGIAKEVRFTAKFVFGERPINTEQLDSLTLDTDIEKLGLSIRPYSALKNINCQKLEDLIKMSRYEILHIKNIGRKGLLEI